MFLYFYREHSPDIIIDKPLADYVHPYIAKPYWWQIGFLLWRVSFLLYEFLPCLVVSVYTNWWYPDDHDWRDYEIRMLEAVL